MSAPRSDLPASVHAGAHPFHPVLSALLAVGGGLLLDAASPEPAWWWAAPIAAAIILAALWGRSILGGVGVAVLAGASFWLPHISWLTLYLGPVPWLALSTVMIAWWALFGVCASLVTRYLRGVLVPAVVLAGLWVTREELQGALPYGGFPWGRLAHTQADGPLAGVASWVGFSGLSAIIALGGAVLAGGAVHVARRRLGRRRAVAGIGAVVVLFVGVAVIPPFELETTGTIRVAGIQGNSKSAIFDDRESGDVLADHIAATEDLLDDLEREDESVDVIVWPENSGEFNLVDNVLASQAVAKLSRRANAPIVVGTILEDPDGTYTNSSAVWGPDGPLEERYDKLHPVPFAEYMPNRAFFHALVPDLVDLVQLEYAAGERPAAFDVESGERDIEAGLAICFDIIFDDQAVAMIDDGAEVIFAQTNNADFGRTDESVQQLAIARLRAIETGRALVNISTVGTSAVVAPDGHDLDRLEWFTSDALLADVPLVEGTTPALRYGAVITAVWVLLGGLGLGGAVARAARERAARRSEATGSRAAREEA